MNTTPYKQVQMAGAALVAVLLIAVGVFVGTKVTDDSRQAETMAVAGGGRGSGTEIAPVDDYPAEWKNRPLDATFDTWRMYTRECTSFAAFRLASRNGFNIPFHDDASNWGPRAKALGYAVNDQPAIGAIAWQASGHVAWVRHIDGDTVYVEDYNLRHDGTYSQYGINRTKFKYIHFKDLPAPAAPTPEPQPAPQVQVAAPEPVPQISVGTNSGGTQGSNVPVQSGGDCCPVQETGHPQQTGGGIQGSAGGSGTGTTVVTPPPTTTVPTTTTRPPATTAPAPSTVAETTGGATHTWTNPANAGGYEGPTIPAFTTVQISCKLHGFKVADGNTWWYRVSSSPWSNQYYASADAFFNNGSTSGSLQGTPFVDPNVPDC